MFGLRLYAVDIPECRPDSGKYSRVFGQRGRGFERRVPLCACLVKPCQALFARSAPVAQSITISRFRDGKRPPFATLFAKVHQCRVAFQRLRRAPQAALNQFLPVSELLIKGSKLRVRRQLARNIAQGPCEFLAADRDLCKWNGLRRGRRRSCDRRRWGLRRLHLCDYRCQQERGQTKENPESHWSRRWA